VDIKYCYGCTHQTTPTEWKKCSCKYPGLTSCGGKRYKRRKDFIKWHKANCDRSLLKKAVSDDKGV
jgi:hypothetical protein